MSRTGRESSRGTAARLGVLFLVSAAIAGAVVGVLALRGGDAVDVEGFRAYDRNLLAAQQPLLEHLRDESATSMVRLPGQFERGEITPAQLAGAAERWETDFAAARDAVRALGIPDGLEGATALILESLDAYVGVATMYRDAAAEGAAAAAIEDPASRRRIERSARLIASRAAEWRTRADRVYDLGRNRVCAVAAELGAPEPGFCFGTES